MPESVEILRADYRCPTCGHEWDVHSPRKCSVWFTNPIRLNRWRCPCKNTHRPQPETTP